MSELTSNGYLIVKVSTAGGAIPVEAVNVIIQGIEDENKNILYISKYVQYSEYYSFCLYFSIIQKRKTYFFVSI